MISAGEYCIFNIIISEGSSDVQCGIPSADLPTLREDASSITGSCEGSVCQLIPDSNGELITIR